ncbi:MAG: pyridoxamine 5'-phosphate oxidase family protein, partial [Phycisphaerales bacterium]
MSTDDHASQFYDAGEGLPDDLPESPFPIFKAWFDHAWAQMATPNPNAMTLATTHADGMPDARIVLCKDMDIDPGCILFYTNEHGSKGQQLQRVSFASAVFHWDHDQRQVRIRGPV